MCPCDPLDANNIILPPTNGGSLLPSLPSFNLPFDALPIPDLTDLFNRLQLILPTGTLKPYLSENFSKNPLDALLSLLEKFFPVLMAFSMILALLKLILCIIEVLCALTNPFKLVRALIRLFRDCLPEVLAILIPVLALIIMIISLLLLILAIILYLIERIIDFIKQLIANIIALADAVNRFNGDSVIAITIKLSNLLCMLANLFVLFGVIALIFQVIKALLNLVLRFPPCDDNDHSSDGCCTPDVCPSFIKNNKQITASTGVLQYLNQVNRTGSTELVRVRSYQFFDPNSSAQLAFNNITHPIDAPAGSGPFFPQGQTYDQGSAPDFSPYIIDIRIFYNPATYGRQDDKGARFIRIKGCIVTKTPPDGVTNFGNGIVSPFNGTLYLTGGTAYEDDGTTFMKVFKADDAAGSLDTVVQLPDTVIGSSDNLPDNALIFGDTNYTFTINHTVLVARSVIAISCHPDVSFNKNFINNTLGAQVNGNADVLSNLQLPDIQGAQDCIVNSINTFRNSVSIETANTLQDNLIGCLNKLQDDTKNVLKTVINTGFDPYKSDFTVDPSIQFTTKPINVSVSLNESSGANMALNLPLDIAASLASQLSGVVSLGAIDEFNYDGYGNFIAHISSVQSGNGVVKVAFDNKFISTFDNPSDIDELPSVSVKEVPYTFVQSPVLPVDGVERRDEGDVARGN